MFSAGPTRRSRRSRLPPGLSGVMFILLPGGRHSAVWSKHFPGSVFLRMRKLKEKNEKKKSKQADAYQNIRLDWKGRPSASEAVTCASLCEVSESLAVSVRG